MTHLCVRCACTDRRLAALDKFHFGFLVRIVGGSQIYSRTWTSLLFQTSISLEIAASQRDDYQDESEMRQTPAPRCL